MSTIANYKIERDEFFDSVQIDTSGNLIIPHIDSTNLPPPLIPGIGGGIAYDTATNTIYYSNGITWLPIDSGATGSTVESYSQSKTGNQSIPPNTATTLTSWTIGTSTAYHTLSGWNLVTGEYTAAKSEFFSINLNVAWTSGVTNQGNRTVRVRFFDSSASTTTTIKEVITQANPDKDVLTTQTIDVSARLDLNDRIFFEVFQDSCVTIPVDVTTTVAGQRFDV